MTIADRLVTVDEFLKMRALGRCELIRGVVIPMSPAGGNHGRIGVRIAGILFRFIEERDLGVAFGAETGFAIERRPDTVRAPDFAFISKSRVQEPVTAGFVDGAPDLAVEVLSPGDAQSEVRAKVAQWLAAGCTSVWVIDPHNQTIDIHRDDASVLIYTMADQIGDEPTLPGLVLNVADVFRRPSSA